MRRTQRPPFNIKNWHAKHTQTYRSIIYTFSGHTATKLSALNVLRQQTET